jgi:hypothetical protein
MHGGRLYHAALILDCQLHGRVVHKCGASCRVRIRTAKGTERKQTYPV